MVPHLKQWWAVHVTWVALAVSFLTPSVNAWVAAHPSYAVSLGAIWAIILHLLPSPVVQKPPQP